VKRHTPNAAIKRTANANPAVSQRGPKLIAWAVLAGSLWRTKGRYWLWDVLDRLWPNVFEAVRQLVLDQRENARGDADAARRRDAFQAGRNVNPIAVEIFPLHEHVTHINSDAQLHSTIGIQLSVAESQLFLDCDRTAHGFNGRAKFGQDAIACRVEDSAFVAKDQTVNNTSMRL
jgi:hypothetical protein